MASESWRSVSPEERETVIQFDDADGHVRVWTAKKSVAAVLQKRGYIPVHVRRHRDGEINGMEFHVPVGQFRWGFKKKTGKLSEARKQALAEGRARKEAEG